MISITDGFSGGGGSTAVGIASKVDEFMTGNYNTDTKGVRANRTPVLTQPPIRRRTKLTKALIEELGMVRRSDNSGNNYGTKEMRFEFRRSFQILGTLTSKFSDGGQIMTPPMEVDVTPQEGSLIKGTWNNGTTFAIEAYDDQGASSMREYRQPASATYTQCSINRMYCTLGDSPTSGPVTACPTSFSLYTATKDGVTASMDSKSFPSPFGTWSISETGSVHRPNSNSVTGNLPAGYEIEYGTAVRIGDTWYGRINGTHTVGVEGVASVSYVNGADIEPPGSGIDDIRLPAVVLYREKGQSGWHGINNGGDIANPIPPGSFSVNITNGVNITAFQEIQITFSRDIKAPHYAFCVRGYPSRTYSSYWFSGDSEEGTNVRAWGSGVKFIGNPSANGSPVSYNRDEFYDPNLPTAINFSWTPVAGAIGYRIYAKWVKGVDTSYDWFMVYDGPATSFNWTGGYIDFSIPTTSNRTRNYPATHDGTLEMDTDELILEPGDVVTAYSYTGHYDNVYYSLPVEFLE